VHAWIPVELLEVHLFVFVVVALLFLCLTLLVFLLL